MELIVMKTSDPIPDSGTSEFTFKLHDEMKDYDSLILDKVFEKIRSHYLICIEHDQMTHSIIVVAGVDVPFYVKFNASALTSYACPLSTLTAHGKQLVEGILAEFERKQVANVDSVDTVH